MFVDVCIQNAKYFHFHSQTQSSLPIVNGVKILLPNFQSFSSIDLDRLKNDDSWLSDTHLSFALLFVHFFLNSLDLTKCHSDGFRDAMRQNLWANLKIQLLDTVFWTKFCNNPDDYTERFQKKANPLECDLLVMPMFET